MAIRAPQGWAPVGIDGSRSPLASLDKRPDGLGHTVSTVKGPEPPAPPHHLFPISVDGPILSKARKQLMRKCSGRGGAPGNLPEACSTSTDRLPPLRQTHQ